MTAKKMPFLKTLEKVCKSSDFQTSSQNVIVTSPYPESTLASTIISQALSRINALFHISISQPVITTDTINDLKERYSASTLILIGLDIVGKGRIKKGKGYPLVIGGTSNSEQIDAFKIGTSSTVTAAAYIFAKSLTDLNDYNLQLAAAGSLLSDNLNGKPKAANKELVDLAINKGLLEEIKGFKLFGASMLPLDEALLFSTYPFLKSISGDQKACDMILNEAEIPIPKLRTPITNLSSAEAQRLTSVLITRLNPDILPHLLGTDYILTMERNSSPLKHISGIKTMNTTAWMQNELGGMISVLLGDRSRALRSLIDNHMIHHRAVISSVQRLESNLEGDSTTTTTTVTLAGTKSEILPDVGRIALDTGIVDTVRPVALDNNETFTIVWPSSKLDTKRVYREFLSTSIRITASSPQSITIIGGGNEKETALQKIVQLNKDADKK